MLVFRSVFERPVSLAAMPSAWIFASWFAVALVLGGCASLGGPDYERPEVPQKLDWAAAPDRAVDAADAIRPDWWAGFGDGYLNQLIDIAIKQNLDLKVLAARVGVAEAAIEQVNAARQPSVSAATGANIQHTSGAGTTRQFNAGGALNWEIDIWGKLKKGVAAQEAGARAAEGDWRAGYLSMVASVAATYFQIRQLDEQLERQDEALAKGKRILQIFEAMHREGLVPLTQALQQQAENNRLTRDRIELERLRSLAQNGLSTLLGKPAGELQVPRARLTQTVRMMDVPAGLPSELLERRPDIVASEYRLLQAHELSGQAKLAKLPSISLTGRAGSSSFALTDLLKSFTFGLLPGIELPIFDPTVNARVRVSEAEAQVAREEYKRTIIKAFEEVENALVSLDSRKQQHHELSQERSRMRTVAEQVQAQLKAGIATQLQVFEAERSLLAAELALLENQQQMLSDTVLLYKALGGGWPREALKTSASEPRQGAERRKAK